MVLTCVSCVRPHIEENEEGFALSLIGISGFVYGAGDGSLIDGAVLTLSAYDMADLSRQNAISSTVVRTYRDGEYRFSILAPPQTKIWALSVEAPGYKKAAMDLYLDTDTRSYDEYSNTFSIESLDFYLDKE